MSTIHACMLSSDIGVDDILDNMLRASDYWQPDATFQWSSSKNSAGLAKAQLYNTTRSQQDSVHSTPDFGLRIVANARLDNREAIIKRLTMEDNDVGEETDGQLILRGYSMLGKDIVKHLKGDFVFIIMDEKNRKFFCARDHFGVKVLYYSLRKQGVMISNEHLSFRESNWCRPDGVDERWLLENLWTFGLGITSGDFSRSPYPDINVLPPAHTLEIDAKGAKLEKYWCLEIKPDWLGLDDDALLQELKRRFNKAVQARLDSKYPIGAELSEGLDSNGIVGFAARHLFPNQLYTFSYRCEALNGKNHHAWADVYSEIEAILALHSNASPVWKSKHGTIDELEQERAFQKRFYRNYGAAIPNRASHFVRAQLAQEHGIRVILSGWGGDHCVTGFGDQYADEQLRAGNILSVFRILRGKNKRGRGAKISRAFPALILNNFFPSLKRVLGRSGELEKALVMRKENHFLDRKWVHQFSLDNTFQAFIHNYHSRSVQQKEQLELSKFLTDRLVESECVGRQYNVEYRYPMLDIDLVEFAHSLPARLKMHNGIERYAFRKVIKGKTTERVRWRAKHDVRSPSLNFEQTIGQEQRWLSEKLKTSDLIKRYSNNHNVTKSLKAGDPLMQDSLAFLLAVEGFFDTSNN